MLRGNRFLDMATVLRGVETASEETLAELRYFDQSRCNRFVHRFTGMAPAEFDLAPTPLLTASLQLSAEQWSGSVCAPRRPGPERFAS